MAFWAIYWNYKRGWMSLWKSVFVNDWNIVWTVCKIIQAWRMMLTALSPSSWSDEQSWSFAWRLYTVWFLELCEAHTQSLYIVPVRHMFWVLVARKEVWWVEFVCLDGDQVWENTLSKFRLMIEFFRSIHTVKAANEGWTVQILWCLTVFWQCLEEVWHTVLNVDEWQPL